MSRIPEQHLQEALAQLPWLERSCVLLSINTNFTQEEIANILNVTEEEVSIATQEGRKQFHRAYYHVSKVKEAQTEHSLQKERDIETPVLVSSTLTKPRQYTTRTQTLSRPAATSGYSSQGGSMIAVVSAISMGLQLDYVQRKVRIDGRAVQKPLSVKEFKLLEFLAMHAGKVCLREETSEAVYGEVYVPSRDTARLDALIERTRQHIGDDQRNPRFIETIRGVGHRLNNYDPGDDPLTDA